MQSVNTSELTGAALDWVVAKCENREFELVESFLDYYNEGCMCYSTNWAQGGPIIEREQISIIPLTEGWEAQFEPSDKKLSSEHLCLKKGPTPLIAAMRCYVASKLGNTIEVPKELLNV